MNMALCASGLCAARQFPRFLARKRGQGGGRTIGPSWASAEAVLGQGEGPKTSTLIVQGSGNPSGQVLQAYDLCAERGA